MTDGDKISEYMQKASSNVRTIGRNAIYAIIACLWAISFTKEGFTPMTSVAISFAFAILYIGVDYFYYFYTSFKYKCILTDNFLVTSNDEMIYKEELKIKEEEKNVEGVNTIEIEKLKKELENRKEEVEKKSKSILTFGSRIVIAQFLLLLFSFLSLLYSLFISNPLLSDFIKNITNANG